MFIGYNLANVPNVSFLSLCVISAELIFDSDDSNSEPATPVRIQSAYNLVKIRRESFGGRKVRSIDPAQIHRKVIHALKVVPVFPFEKPKQISISRTA